MNKQELNNKLDETKQRIQDLLQKAKREGIEEVEIYAGYYSGFEVSLEKNDVNTSISSEETNFGVRVIANHCQGFVTTNNPDSLEGAIKDAKSIALAQNTPDPAMELPSPSDTPTQDIQGLYLQEMDSVSMEDIMHIANDILLWQKEKYPLINIDSGNVSLDRGFKIIGNSKGTLASEMAASMSAGFMGMAVDGDDIGSFDYDSATGRTPELFQKDFSHSLESFGEKCMGCLQAQNIGGFKGHILVPPQSVFSFLGDLLSSLTATQIRRKRSKFGDKLGEKVASPLLSIFEDPSIPSFGRSTAFDREGVATEPKEIITTGVIKNFFYNHFEAKKAGLAASHGNASGSSSSTPSCGPKQLQVIPGKSNLKDMFYADEKAILINRFSGSSNSSSGDFSGSVKGGALLHKGNRTPVKELTISGNIYEVLNQITAISRERKLLASSSHVPWIQFSGIDITGMDEAS
ncbi:MAG: TldD/PmbA family protein [Spirochaetota bacterium]